MSLGSMAAELTGIIPQIPVDYAKTLVQRAWGDIQRKSMWSFLMFEANWATPAIVNAGTATYVQGSNQVTFNSAASAAILAIGLFPSSVTQRQFRVGIGTIYNIWAIDSTTPTAVVLTLDRGFAEASGTSAYQIYQCYFVSPVSDFWQWLNVRDVNNFNDLITTKTREWVDLRDPQRSINYIPTHVVLYGIDLNPASLTYRYPMFELWGQPVSILTYQLAGLRKSWPLTAMSDTLPPQIGEDCVMALAQYYAYAWGEANWKGEYGQRPAFAFLMRELVNNNPRGATGLFNRLYREYRMQDRATGDLFQTALRRGWSFPNVNGWFSSIAGVASPGAPW